MLILVVFSSIVKAIIKEQTSRRRTTLTFTLNSEVIIAKKSLI